MKKNYLLCIMMCFCTSLWIYAVGSTNGDGSAELAVKKAYGFLISDYTSPVGLCCFETNDATNLTMIKETNKVSAGAWIKGAYYGATYDETGPLNWSVFDLETGDETILHSLAGTVRYTDMSYDYSTGKLYAISHPEQTMTRISVVNLSDGSGEVVLDVDKQLLTIACRYDGVLFAIDTEGTLYSINKLFRQITTLGDLGFKPNYVQSMEFDHETGVLYWAACNDNYSTFFSVDVDKVEIAEISGLGNYGDMTGLYIPFILSEPEAPGAVTHFSVEPVTGKNAVKIGLTLPAITASGKVLTTLQCLSVECDGELLKKYISGTDFTFVADKEMTLELDAPAGLHTFRVFATNEVGDGVPMENRLFVGKDIPAAPENIVMEVDGSKVNLKWNPVVVGVQGGEIDKASLVYTVMRFPDNKLIAENIKESSLEDEVPSMDVYCYEVTAYTAQGKGGSAKNEWQVAGEVYEMPFSYDFGDEAKFKLWTVIDNNDDETTWKLSQTYESEPTAVYNYSSDNAGDDWMITPPLKLKGGQAYKLKFACGVQNPRYPERLKVTMGRDNTVEAQTIELGTYELTEYGLNPHIIYLPESIETGNWYVAFQACSDKDKSRLYVSNVEIEENVMGTLNGTVMTNGEPLVGATVSLSNSDETFTTDSEGHFFIGEIAAGTYTLKINCFGYENFSEELTFDILEKKTETVTLTSIKTVTLNGKVKTIQGESIPDATVYLYGYDSYIAHTDKEGDFTIENVYCKGDYKLEGYVLNYDIGRLDIPAFTQNVTTNDLVLEEKLLAPAHFVIDASNAAVDLTWDRPEDRIVEFRYDDGEPPLFVLNMELEATPDALAGCIYDTPTVLTGMSWQVANNSNPKTTVDIIILDLDENGKPTKNILFEKKGVPSTDSYWSSYQFPYPVVAPRGALVALHGDAFLCMDYGTSTEWPVQVGKSCYSFDYINRGFINVDGRNLLVRAEGLQLGAPHQEAAMIKAPMPQPKYLVWRMAEEDVENVGNWTSLTAEPVASTTFKDVTWKDVAKGIYKYAVKAVYTGGEFSHPAITERVPRLLTAGIAVSLTTNIAESAEGALVTMISKDEIHSYTAVAGADGKCIVPAVWEGDYTLVIGKSGFTSLKVDIHVEGGKDLEKEFVLLEDARIPSNLKIDENGTPGSRLFRWNVVEKWEDDFEGHEDFTINSPGELGWSYIDGDGAPTYSSSSYDFPHINEPMAFIAFNPSAAEPSMLDEMVPHSGDKLLCCFASTGGVQNNDYIISPELEVSNDFVIRFWASSYHSRFLEVMRVGYSTTGKNEEDFVWVGENQTVPAEWTEYIVNIPKEAKYVTINCISNDCYILMLDDIYIGAPEQSQIAEGINRIAGLPISYEVYLDGQSVATTTTTETSYTFTELSKGEHTAGVKAVFASGATDMSAISFEVEEGQVGMEETVHNGFVFYPLPVKDVLHIDGVFDEAKLINSSGKVMLHTGYAPTIQMEQYPAGMYYLVLKKEGRTTVIKVPVR